MTTYIDDHRATGSDITAGLIVVAIMFAVLVVAVF